MFPVLLAFLLSFVYFPVTSPNIVISQVYGGGGNSGAAYRNDFVELFNRSSSVVSLTGWSLQYASATGATWSKVDLTGNLGPGQYYLIQLASGGGAGAALPSPDATSSISMAATAGKVALVNGTALLAGSCPTSSSFADLAGYGLTANCYEGAGPGPAPSATRSIIRANDGCNDNDNNSTDFSAVSPQPRNLATTAKPCQAAPPPPPPPPPVNDSGGSVLVFPFYSSSTTSPASENTLIALTNTDETRNITVHLLFTMNESTEADRFLTLTPNQTTAMLASEIDPGVFGSLTVVPVDSTTGCPIRFDGISGSAQIKLASQHAGSLQAIRLPVADGPPPACGLTAEVICTAPRVIAGTLLSSEDGYRHLLFVTRIAGTLGTLTGTLFNDAENVFSFSFNSPLTQLRADLGPSFPRTTPRLSIIIPAGRSGWFKLSAQTDAAIVGAIFTHNPRAGILSTNSGRNLHHLSLTRATISVQVTVPT